MVRFCVIFMTAGFVSLKSALAVICTWDSSTGDWFDGGKWTGGVPGNGDTAIINGGSVLLTSETAATLALLQMTGGILTMSNWTTRIQATEVQLENSAQITLPPAFTNGVMSNRVWIVCSNLTIGANASINVDGKGWAGGNGTNYPAGSYGSGPGGGNKDYAGGAYGGRGGDGGGAGGIPYGSAEAPLDPGSGGGAENTINWLGGNGGGAVFIDATGLVTINGTITANATGTLDSSGSGGGIYINCHTFTGEDGIIRAASASTANGGGGGGRIAVIYNAGAQSALAKPRVTFSVATGPMGGMNNADIGTIYLTDTTLLDETWLPHTGRILWGGSSWTINTLIVTNGLVRLAQSNLQITVSNDVVVSGASAKLQFGGNSAMTNYDRNGNQMVYTSENEMPGFPVVNIGGNLVLTNGGKLTVYSGTTNATSNTGSLVRVAGRILIYSNSWIYPHSQPFTGGTPVFQAKKLWIEPTANTNAGIDASGRGFRGGTPAHPAGWGYGGAGQDGAGGYGGRGGGIIQSARGPTYGDSNAPALPGSGGGGEIGAWWGANGGGSVRIEASDTVSVKGKILANGGWTPSSWTGGSGGGIYIQCVIFEGDENALLSADGSGGAYVGAGGGRIAVWRRNTNTVATSVLGAYGSWSNAVFGEQETGHVGTVVWAKQVIPPGTIMAFR